jgi:hypothetical protein
MTNFTFPKSDRELWGLRGPVRAFIEQYISPASAPADLQQPEFRMEFNRDGMRVGKVGENGVAFGVDQAGRKTKTRVSRPEDYVPNLSAGGSPFSIADRRPNLPEGGKATTYYDQYDRPVEAQVRGSRDELVVTAMRIYDQMGRVTEEERTIHDPAAFLPAALRTQLSSNHQIKEWMNGWAGNRSVKFFYDSENQVIRTVRLGPDKEEAVVTTYNEHGDPEVEITTTKPIIGGDAEATQSSYSETRYSYQYDQAGNWTEKAEAYRPSPEGAFEAPTTIRRILEYF